MSTYETTTTFDALAHRILAAERVMLTSHVKPDGDAMGSALALSRALGASGPRTDIWMMGPLESRLLDLAGPTPYRLVEQGMPGDEHDLVVVLDTGAWSQLAPIADWLRDRADRVVGIDHHARGDDVAPQRIVDPGAASTTQMLVPLIEAMGLEITPGRFGVAEALFVGLATDTGWFRFSSAGPEAFRLAARLMDLGVDKTHLYKMIEETFRPQRLALSARALTSLLSVQSGAVTIMTLAHEDFVSTGGETTDVSELVNLPLSVSRVHVSILISEAEPGRVKVSFRSKPPTDDACQGVVTDMNELAHRFGGGGHRHAAGALIRKPVAEALAAIVEAVDELCRVTI